MGRAEDRAAVEALFDEWGEREWERLAVDVSGRVSFEIHRRFMVHFLRAGARVLEIGAGPGRFTIPLAKLGCRVVVTDISPVQLQLNEERVRAAGADDAVEARVRADVCDLSRYSDGEFDAVVAYGGPLSYAFDAAPDALAECLRVTRTGGVVLASVMSLAGSARHFSHLFLHDIDVVGLDVFSDFLQHGDQRAVAAAGAHQCRLFSWADVQGLVRGVGGRLLAGSASNWLSLGPVETIEAMERDATVWARFLDWEERFCQEPGAVDGGTHLLFAVEPA